MSAELLLKPLLYAATGDARPGGRCELRGGVCACGYVFFPLQSYGCERCGRTGEHLRATLLSGRGTLLARAEVRVHQGQRKTPFVIGSIRLEEGPVVRTLLLEGSPLSTGAPLQAVLAEADGPDGTCVLDLRFGPQ